MRIISFFQLELIKQAVFGILTVCIIVRAIFGSGYENNYNRTKEIDTIETEKRIIRLIDTIEMKNMEIIHLQNMLLDDEKYHIPEIMKLRISKHLIDNDGITIDERGRRRNKDFLRKKTRNGVK